jgi:hypothetical protein
MSRLLKIVLVLFLALPLAAVAFVAGMRYVEPEPPLMAALKQMQAPVPPVRGRDGSDAVWLLDYDLPADAQAEASAAAQLRRYEAARARVDAGAAAATELPPDPRAAWKRFPEQPGEEQGVCSAMHGGCLAYVEANRPLVAATLAEHEDGLAKALAFSDHDGLRIGVLPSLSSELPHLGSRRRLVLSYFANRFVSGERLGAVEGLCRDLGGWRRMGADNDSLVVSMVGVGFVKQDLVLLAEMLAKLPKETEIPNECAQALRPSTDDEFDLCPSMRTDFRTVIVVPELMDRGEKGWLRPSLQLDRRNFEALVAADRARYCAAPLHALARADRKSGSALAPPPRCARLRRLADPVGCALGEAASVEGYDGYLDRRTDQAAMLALMRTVVWLRDNAASPEEVEAALARRPAELGLQRTPRYQREEDRLSIALIDQSRGGDFTLAAGAQPRPVKRRARPSGSRRPSARNLALE